MKKIVNTAKRAGSCAIIASDQAVISFASSINMEVHISTQTNITNLETIRFYSHFADVVVLSRELSLGQVKEMTNAIKNQQIKGPSGNLIQIEIFLLNLIILKKVQYLQIKLDLKYMLAMDLLINQPN